MADDTTIRIVIRVERQAWGCVVFAERHEERPNGSRDTKIERLSAHLLQVGSYDPEYKSMQLRARRAEANAFAKRVAAVFEPTELILAED